MSEKEPKQKLADPWRSLHSAVWLVGLAILFWKGWIWPGILVLIGISMLLEAVLRSMPHAYEEEDKKLPEPSLSAETPHPALETPPAPAVEHRLELLPATCPKCGGPLRGHEVKWTGSQSAECPFCGTNLPVSRG